MSYLKRFIKRRTVWLSSRFLKKCLILIYHRIGNLRKELDPFSLTVSPERFSGHLKILKTHFSVLSLSELAHRISVNDFPEKSVVITFDDGYRDNLLLVKPLLEEYRIPAAFFFTSKYFGTYFWWDALVNFIAGRGRNGKIVLHGEEFLFSQDGRGLQTLFDGINIFFRSLEYTSKIDFVNEINHLPFAPCFSDSAKCMSAEEIKTFSTGPYVEIGGHTASHFPLSTLDHEIQKSEISGNKTELENLLQKEVKHFAYPNGDYNDSAVNIVKDLFKTGLTGNLGTVQKDSNLFLLNRISVKNYESRFFYLFLKYWL